MGQTDTQTDIATTRLNWPRGGFSEEKEKKLLEHVNPKQGYFGIPLVSLLITPSLLLTLPFTTLHYTFSEPLNQ